MDGGEKGEEGFQPPVEDWKPPEEEEKHTSVENTTSAEVMEATEVTESGRSEHQERDAKRLLRALKKIAHNKLRERKNAGGRKPQEHRPGCM
jgi:hypothetical protein